LHATSTIVAMLVTGAGLLTAGLVMLGAAIRARLAWRRALKTRRRVMGTVIGNKTTTDEGTTLYCPIVEFTDPRTGRPTSFSPSLYVNRPKLGTGRDVDVLWDERGREPILNVGPFRTGCAGSWIFFLLAILCAGCGALAIYAVAF
jgi:hypothetical protein